MENSSNASAVTDSFPVAVKWIGAGVMSMWVSIPAAVQLLLMLMACDYCTGLLCAWIKGTWSAREGFRGLARKTLTLVLVFTASRMSTGLSLGFDLGAVVSLAFTINEGISIMENCAIAGVPIPEPLLAALVKAKKLAGRTKSAAEVEKEIDGA